MPCPDCGREYGKRRRCYYCHPGRKKTGITKPCEECGEDIYVQPNQLERGEGKYCSYECKYEAARGVERVTGTRHVRSDGYVEVKVGVRDYELEHRLVAEEKLGRALSSDEHVHHINGDKQDNSPENLVVVTNSEHQHLHRHDHPQRQSQKVTLICEQCGDDYERKPSRSDNSRWCSRSCQMRGLRALRHKD